MYHKVQLVGVVTEKVNVFGNDTQFKNFESCYWNRMYVCTYYTYQIVKLSIICSIFLDSRILDSEVCSRVMHTILTLMQHRIRKNYILILPSF